jgi:predicted membrane protein
MDNPKSPHELEQELINVRHSLRQEKLKKADQLLAHRLVYSAIILVILFMILCGALKDASNWVQWPCLIVFFGAVLFTVGRISVHYIREKKAAEK